MSLAEAASALRSSLEIPLDPAHILTARLFAGGVARSLGLQDEIADVVRLAVSEICSEAIERRRSGRLTIEIEGVAGQIRIAVVATGDDGDDTPFEPADTTTYRRTLIEALAPDASFLDERDRLTVTFMLSAAHDPASVREV